LFLKFRNTAQFSKRNFSIKVHISHSLSSMMWLHHKSLSKSLLCFRSKICNVGARVESIPPFPMMDCMIGPVLYAPFPFTSLKWGEKALLHNEIITCHTKDFSYFDLSMLLLLLLLLYMLLLLLPLMLLLLLLLLLLCSFTIFHWCQCCYIR